MKARLETRLISPYEKDIQRAISEWLDLKKFFFWRSNNIPVFGRNNAGHQTFRALPKYTPKGLPDLIIVHEGMFIGLEVKRDGGKLSEHQVIFRDNILQNGGQYYMVSSVDEVIEIMSKYLDR